jgi:putative endonuclease
VARFFDASVSALSDNSGSASQNDVRPTNTVKTYYVYIMTNTSRTLYTGVANNLLRRVYEHKHKLIPGFTSRYNITQLVYFEETSDVRSALEREKQIKGWLRAKKIALIESLNPQ